MKKLIPLLIVGPLILASTGCSPDQVQGWLEWHSKDPAAAEAFANEPAIRDLIVKDWDHDGVIEPDPAPKPRRATPTNLGDGAPKRTSRPAAPAATGRSGVNWDRVAQCESGGQWHHPPVTNRFGTFSGGLMIMNSAWRQFGGQQFASLAYLASREAQIVVAERIAARVGAARAWQCPV